jgi:hypothetical protein
MPWTVSGAEEKRKDFVADFVSGALRQRAAICVLHRGGPVAAFGVVDQAGHRSRAHRSADHPEQNGRHERTHRTLKEAAASPPKANRRMQQRAFDQFRREYNQVRPHQALAMETPESVYRSSPRPFPGRLPEHEYDTAMKVRHVFKHGQFFFNRHDVFQQARRQAEIDTDTYRPPQPSLL